MTGLLADNIVVPYRNIRELGRCSQLLVPISITITYEEMETGKRVTDKISADEARQVDRLYGAKGRGI